MATEKLGGHIEGSIEEMRAKEINKYPKDIDNWICEPYWNGPRAFVFVGNETRLEVKGHDKKQLFPEFHKPLLALGQKHSAIMESRIIYIGPKENHFGTSKQERQFVEARLTQNPQNLITIDNCSLVLTDLIKLEGQDVRTKTLEERKSQLANLCQDLPEKSDIVPTITSQDAESLAQALREFGFEKMLFKKRESFYIKRPNHPFHWLEMKL